MRHRRITTETALPRDTRAETAWVRMTVSAVAAAVLATISVLTVTRYATLPGVNPGNPATWLLPAGYGAAAGTGLIWAEILRTRRPGIYQQIGLGADAATPRLTTVQGSTP
jgi:ABC-type phosphate transport system auxiliary subunit